jgi:hypothetical protein
VEAEIRVRPLTAKDLMRELNLNLNLNGGQLLGSILPPSQLTILLDEVLVLCFSNRVASCVRYWYWATGKVAYGKRQKRKETRRNCESTRARTRKSYSQLGKAASYMTMKLNPVESFI